MSNRNTGKKCPTGTRGKNTQLEHGEEYPKNASIWNKKEKCLEHKEKVSMGNTRKSLKLGHEEKTQMRTRRKKILKRNSGKKLPYRNTGKKCPKKASIWTKKEKCPTGTQRKNIHGEHEKKLKTWAWRERSNEDTKKKIAQQEHREKCPTGTRRKITQWEHDKTVLIGNTKKNLQEKVLCRTLIVYGKQGCQRVLNLLQTTNALKTKSSKTHPDISTSKTSPQLATLKHPCYFYRCL